MPLAGKAGAGTPRGDTGGTGGTPRLPLNRGRKRAIGLLADSPVSAQYLGQFVFIWPRRGTCTYSVTSSVKQENTVSEWDWRENTTNPRLRRSKDDFGMNGATGWTETKANEWVRAAAAEKPSSVTCWGWISVYFKEAGSQDLPWQFENKKNIETSPSVTLRACSQRSDSGFDWIIKFWKLAASQENHRGSNKAAMVCPDFDQLWISPIWYWTITIRSGYYQHDIEPNNITQWWTD